MCYIPFVSVASSLAWFDWCNSEWCDQQPYACATNDIYCVTAKCYVPLKALKWFRLVIILIIFYAIFCIYNDVPYLRNKARVIVFVAE